jgi:hypothetical protein
MRTWKTGSDGRSGGEVLSVFIYLGVLYILFFSTFLLCWGYIVAFTKVLTIYQIHHTWIHPLHHFPLFPSPHSWNSFNRSHFSIYIHVYSVFALYSHPHLPMALSPPPPHLPMGPTSLLSRKVLFCTPVLWFYKRKKWHFCLFKIAIHGVSFVALPCIYIL